ncbi:TetR/AcrR family transcriptional regulator [Jeotgalibacillus marinus]|uniref:TetR/AcrR family transcriptional regulator n=1 Tax=Jeotgalibacillus marinus TaxID=86667 RepID=A0ABV3Q197_9BACL
MSDDTKIFEELFDENKKLTEKQKKIIAAAIESFAEKGYAATSTSEIANKAGVAEGTIFRHYKTKKDLLLAIASPVMAKFLAPFVIKDLNKVLNQKYEHYEDFMKAMIKNRALFLKENIPLFRILIQEIPFQPELKEQFTEHVAQKIIDRLEKTINHYQEKGQIIEMPTYTVMRVTISTIFGYLIARYILAPEGDWDDEVEINRTVEILMHGLAPKEA